MDRDGCIEFSFGPRGLCRLPQKPGPCHNHLLNGPTTRIRGVYYEQVFNDAIYRVDRT